MLRQLGKAAAPRPTGRGGDPIGRAPRARQSARDATRGLAGAGARPALGRLLLYPICAYFVLLSPRAQRRPITCGAFSASARRSATCSATTTPFASTIQDRVYFLTAGTLPATTVRASTAELRRCCARAAAASCSGRISAASRSCDRAARGRRAADQHSDVRGQRREVEQRAAPARAGRRVARHPARQPGRAAAGARMPRARKSSASSATGPGGTNAALPLRVPGR